MTRAALFGATCATSADCTAPSEVCAVPTCVCANGYYFNTGAGICSPCDSSCATCSGPTVDDCTSCGGTAQLAADVGDFCNANDQCAVLAVANSSGGTCVTGACALSGCNAGYFVTGSVCTACTAISNCTAGFTCTGAGNQQCTACAGGTHLIAGPPDSCATCTSACAAGTFESTACTSSTDRACTACTAITNCTAGFTCTGAGNQRCTTCAGGTHLIVGPPDSCATCASACAAGTFESTACTSSTDRACTACTAITNCTAGFTCTGAGNQRCTACASGTHLIVGPPDSCAPCSSACAAGTYESTACTSSTDRVCTPCTPVVGCTAGFTCTGAGDQRCTACVGGDYLIVGPPDSCAACTGACGVGTYESAACTGGANRACTACTPISGCIAGLHCTGSSDQQCTNVVLTYPPEGGSASTTVVRPTLTGTGVSGQSVTVSADATTVCTTTIAAGAWSCVPTANLPVGSLAITATSAGKTSAGTLVVTCTVDGQCGTGQVCNTTSGSCATPACLGNSGSSSGADCTAATPVCLNPNTPSAVCSTCPMAQVYNAASFACVSPSVALTFPAAGATTNTTDVRYPLAGTGVPGQLVTVVASGVTLCSTTVVTNGSWACAPSADLALGALTLVATSAGASSSAVLVVQCTQDGQCTTGQVCNLASGACVTPSCLGNAGVGSGRDCPAGAPVCTGPNTSGAACGACGAGQVYDVAAFVCVAPAVALTTPPAGVTTNTTDVFFPIHGTGVAGQPVSVTEDGAMICAAIVAATGTWTCTPTTSLPLGMLAIVAASAGASSSATLNVECALDSQCLTGQVCDTSPGVCIAPLCRGNAGTGSASDCPGATPVCTAPGTAGSACGACTGTQVYDTTAHVCVSPSVSLTNPPAGGSATTALVRPALTGTGIPSQSVALTANGMSACTTTVAANGGWSCNPTFDLAVGSQSIVATSAGATSTGTLIVTCTLDVQCGAGQVCNTSSGSCVTPSCLGNADSGTARDCPDGSPICSAPDTAAAACGTCSAALVYDDAAFACVAPTVALTSPPADTTTATTNLRPPVNGTGVPGQAVAVTDNGAALCSATVAAAGTWTCTPSTNLPLGSNTVVATSAGVASSGVFVVACTLDAQCGTGQVCNTSNGICVTLNCLGNSGSGSAADCTAAAPVCTAPGTANASCDPCATGQVFNTATFACVSPIVALTAPPAGGFASTTNPRAPIAGTGVAGQSVSVTVNGQSVCTTSVALNGTWTCTPSLDLSVGALMVTATSGGATSTGTLTLLCTSNVQCTTGQACDTTTGGCVTPSCLGNAGSGSTADCAASAPVCSNAGTAQALCGPCAVGQVYDTTGRLCVSPAVVLTSPPAGGSASTQQLLPSIAGTGIPGQTVTVSVNGLTICTASVEPDRTWSCVPSTNLPIGADTITANSAGAVSSGTLVVQCTLDAQCGAGQVCDTATGTCTTPNCTDNAGAGTTANCPSATPVCQSPGTAGASCVGCATGQVYDTTAHVCLAGTVVLTFPPADGTASTTSATPAVSGIGVPGQSVTVTSGAQTICVTIVLADGTWTCTSTVILLPGSNTITADSAGATSTGTLVEHCTLSVQCASAAPACEVTSGLCVGCVADAGCASGAYCDTTLNTCTPTRPDGDACDRDAQCTAGVCTVGICGPASTDGGVGDGGGTDQSGGDDGGVDGGVDGGRGEDGGTDGGTDGAGADAADSGTHVPTLGGGGCDCTTTGTQAGGGALAGLALLLLALARRRSRRRSRTSARG